MYDTDRPGAIPFRFPIIAIGDAKPPIILSSSGSVSPSDSVIKSYSMFAMFVTSGGGTCAETARRGTGIAAIVDGTRLPPGPYRPGKADLAPELVSPGLLVSTKALSPGRLGPALPPSWAFPSDAAPNKPPALVAPVVANRSNFLGGAGTRRAIGEDPGEDDLFDLRMVDAAVVRASVGD